jgi:replicative DNA helicase
MTAHTSAPADPLPVNIEAEQALLGACLINNDAIAMVSSFLEARHFSEGLHARIYETMCELAGQSVRGSAVTLKSYLGDIELPSGVTIQAYLARLAAEATTVIDAPDYAAMIVDMWRRRELIRVTQDIAEAARTPFVNVPTGDLLDELEVRTTELRNSAPAETGRSTVAGGVDELLIDIETVRSGDAPPIATSGFLDIDRRLGGGLRPGRLIVLAGRPGMGKTVLMCALARRAARKGFGVDIYSLEIDRKELTARMLANALGATAFPLDYRDILSGRVVDSDIPRLAQLRDKFAEIPLSIDATPALRISQIESRAKRTALRLARGGKKLDVVFIDYLGLVSVGDRYKGNKVAELGDIALGAKNMAKRLGCAVVLLSQLNRSVESRDDKRPLLSDLRESGNIEEHTDAVGFLYRPAYYDDQDPRKERDAEFADAALRRANDLEIIWRKNRLGPTGTDKLYCRVERSFVDNGERYR